MKKNLNIAYLNGAEGLVRKAASSGGSGGGDNDVLYYKLTDAFKQKLEEDGSMNDMFFCAIFGVCSNFIIKGRYGNGFDIGGYSAMEQNDEMAYIRAMNMNGFAVTVPFFSKGNRFNSYEEYNILLPEHYERITKEEYFGMITSES